MNNYNQMISLLCPYISGNNMGDEIINDYISKQLNDIFGNTFYVRISTRDRISKRSANLINWSEYAFVCGTNLLASNVRKRKQWNISFVDSLRNNKKFILFGTGWWQYQNNPDLYTSIVYKNILSHDITHSVRDSYSEEMLKKAGINNVVNTACPTMWGLTPDHCKKIPCEKAKNVITTLTDYMKNPESDMEFLRILKRLYDKIYIWLQSPMDFSYIQSLKLNFDVDIIEPGLIAYDKALQEIDADYVGTRLHGGIRALNFRHRSIIIGVDNRANEIAKDTNLVVVDRSAISEQLPAKIESAWSTEIHLPEENILLWKRQFKQ